LGTEFISHYAYANKNLKSEILLVTTIWIRYVKPVTIYRNTEDRRTSYTTPGGSTYNTQLWEAAEHTPRVFNKFQERGKRKIEENTLD
jgi:hypothetical protein